MGFIDSYKRLEKLCGDVMGCDRPVTAYIDEMKATPRGANYVAGWGSDLEMLKRYRWIRNQIAHEPGCTEANMCGAGDAAWIDQFYGRIMDQTDPLALYEKEMKRQRRADSALCAYMRIKNREEARGGFFPAFCALGGGDPQ